MHAWYIIIIIIILFIYLFYAITVNTPLGFYTPRNFFTWGLGFMMQWCNAVMKLLSSFSKCNANAEKWIC